MTTILAAQPQGRPEGSGRALSSEQEEKLRRLVVDTTSSDPDIASATWTRQAVAELMANRFGIELTVQGVRQYLRRWGLTPQKPAMAAGLTDHIWSLREVLMYRVPRGRRVRWLKDFARLRRGKSNMNSASKVLCCVNRGGDNPIEDRLNRCK